MAAKRRLKDTPQRRLYLSNTKARARINKRVRYLVQDAGGVTLFSKIHSVSPKYVYKWYSEGMVPGTNHLIKFAQNAQISPDWLLLGRGKPYFNKAA